MLCVQEARMARAACRPQRRPASRAAPPVPCRSAFTSFGRLGPRPHPTSTPRLPAAATVTYEDAAVGTATQPAQESPQKFAWECNWWPVHVLNYLDASRPTPIELLGMQLVLWRDASGTWRCFRDSCPHRRVPLSEGRVEGGELVCSYHGWRFDQGGACTAIPQAPDAKSLAAATSSPRSCVTSFPTQEASGLLWVWPEESPAAAANAAAVAPPLPNAFNQPRFEGQMEEGWYMRELPYDYDILLENVADPSHLPYAHHGLAPTLNRQTAPPIPFTPLDDLLLPDDSDVLANGTPPICAFQFPTQRSQEHRVLFSAPHLVTYHTKKQGTMTVILAVPTGPGRSKVFVASSMAATVAGMPWLKAAKNMFGAALPKWLSHAFMMRLFDGDSVFLNAQSNFLRATERQAGKQAGAEGPTWAKEYYMPMTSDRAVVAARKWIDTVSGGGRVYPASAAPATQQVSREQLLDRHAQHTKHCPHCQRGLAFGGRMETVGKVLLAAAFFALCCLVGANGWQSLVAGNLPSKGAVAVAACAVVAAWLRLGGEWLQKQFTFTDYVHADIP